MVNAEVLGWELEFRSPREGTRLCLQKDFGQMRLYKNQMSVSGAVLVFEFHTIARGLHKIYKFIPGNSLPLQSNLVCPKQPRTWADITKP